MSCIPNNNKSDIEMGDQVCFDDGENMICWVRLGEGRSGDYDPEDPDDIEVFRVDIKEWNPESSDWDEVDSACTGITVDTKLENSRNFLIFC